MVRVVYELYALLPTWLVKRENVQRSLIMHRKRPFRLAVSYKGHNDITCRPPLPKWLRPENKKNSTRNQSHSFNYWTKIYWATPPWFNDEMYRAMKAIYNSAKPGEEVDHIVPLSHPLVCGLNVPWNMRVISKKGNQMKSNNVWPDMPFEQTDLFIHHEVSHESYTGQHVCLFTHTDAIEKGYA